MTEGIYITADEIFIRKWNGDERQWEDTEIDPEELVNFCWDPTFFEGEITLKRLFNLIEPAKDQWESLIQENIKPLLEEIKKPPSQNRNNYGLEHLELQWIAESDKFQEKKTFEFNLHFMGIGHAKDLKDVPEGEEITYSVEFKPVNEIQDYQVVLNPNVKLTITDFDSPGHKEEKTDLGEYVFTLFDIFRGIFWELTFMGPPEQRNEKFQEILDAVEEIKQNPDSMTPAEEVFDDIKKRLDEECENYQEKPIKKKRKRRKRKIDDDWGL